MAAGEIATLSHTVIMTASAIQKTGNNWYRASADWNDFPRKVANLQKKHDLWQGKLTQYGLLSDTSLNETLSEAKAILDDEQAKLSSRKTNCCGGLWPKVGMTAFPAKIGLTMQQAIEAFDAILGQLKEEHEVHVALVTSVIDKAPTFTVPNDDRYVPFVTTETALYSALEDLEARAGPSIVLLHGSSGKGKSTLARHAVLRYQQPPHSLVFDRVVFLECGPEAERSAKQFDLLQLLGPTMVACEEQDQEKTSRDWAIRKQLSSFLKDQKILIILDDIWKEEFLKYMVELCGARVKCLVTSQRGDLCQRLGFSVTRILIEDVDEAVAMQILASHVGLKNKQIPEPIQGLAKQLVEKSEAHPLALASIATAIDVNRAEELVEWEAASQNFLDLLHSEDTAYIHGEKYPRSFWSAMELSVNSLKKDAKNLLILVHMCAGPSISEDVLRVLYLSVKFQGTSEPFEKTRKDLESRELIKITSLEKRRSWSVHSLQKLFVEKKMKDLKESVFTLLALKTSESGIKSNECGMEPRIIPELPAVEDAMVQNTLCALYFDEDFSDRIVSDMGIGSQGLSELRRNVIEPITELLGRPLSEHWNTCAKSSAKQIFLQYIHNNVLNSEGVLQLLQLKISILPMLNALESVATIDARKESLLDSNSRGVTKALVDLLEGKDTGDAIIAMAAARAVQKLGANKFHFEIIISSGILEAIVRISSSESNTDLQVLLIDILRTVGWAVRKSGAADLIVETPGILPFLVRSLFIADNAALQLSAMKSLGILTHTKRAEHRIVHFSGVLEQLINLLSKDSVPLIQEQAARALSNLCKRPEETMLMVINSPQALEQLVKLLSLENNPTLDAREKGHTYYAARTLTVLSRRMRFMEPAKMEHVKQKFSETHGLTDRLHGLIAKGIPGSIQEEAIQVLTYIDPAQGNGACLHSAKAFSGRGLANMILGRNKDSFEDLSEAYKRAPRDPKTLRRRSTVRVRLGDIEGALADANTAVEIDESFFNLQERGIVKRMLGDLPGALIDLDKGLDLDSEDYELLKHRGYVRFLMNDEKGARSDAEMALKAEVRKVANLAYGNDCLGTTSVEFLDYKLRVKIVGMFAKYMSWIGVISKERQKHRQIGGGGGWVGWGGE